MNLYLNVRDRLHRVKFGVQNRVAMTNRLKHAPTAESNAVIYEFFERFLKG